MKSLEQVLISKKSILAPLIVKANRLQCLDKLLRSFLDPELAQHCMLAEVKSEEEGEEAKNGVEDENKKKKKSKRGEHGKHKNNGGRQEALIIADNAAWATRLRYAIPELLKSVNTQPEFANLQKIHCRVKSDLERDECAAPVRRCNQMSPENERMWRELMQQLREKSVAR